MNYFGCSRCNVGVRLKPGLKEVAGPKTGWVGVFKTPVCMAAVFTCRPNPYLLISIINLLIGPISEDGADIHIY